MYTYSVLSNTTHTVCFSVYLNSALSTCILTLAGLKPFLVSYSMYINSAVSTCILYRVLSNTYPTVCFLVYLNSALSTCIPTVANLKPSLFSYFMYINSALPTCISTISYLKNTIQCPTSCILTVPCQRVSLQCLI